MKNNEFNYSYSAPTVDERRELENIKKEYLEAPVGDEKLQTVRSLDKKVKEIPSVISLITGIAGCLVFGLGMTCCLEWNKTMLGVIVGAVGAALMIIAYPVFKAIKKKLKEKYGAEILKLTNELLNENNQND